MKRMKVKTGCEYFPLALLPFLLVSCGGESGGQSGTAVVTRFVNNDFTQLEKIEMISKFRSGEGHDFSTTDETCRSMKHYYEPYTGYKEKYTIEIYSPVDGTIVGIEDDSSGSQTSGELINRQVYIQSSSYSSYTFRLFHVDLASSDISSGKTVTAGELIGYAYIYSGDTSETRGNFDIAVTYGDSYGSNWISFFDLMTDSLFESYIARGASSRDDFIISKEARDATPMNCNGDQFTGSDPLGGWFTLNQ